jgi:5-methylcytosine-specific restriction protein A
MRPYATEYHHLYSKAQWKRQRLAQLQAEPLCCFCEAKGVVEAATVADHKDPHKGDPELFFDADNLQSLCKRCHDSTKARIESRGYHCEVDRLTGLPTDPNHPANKR